MQIVILSQIYKLLDYFKLSNRPSKKLLVKMLKTIPTLFSNPNEISIRIYDGEHDYVSSNFSTRGARHSINFFNNNPALLGSIEIIFSNNDRPTKQDSDTILLMETMLKRELANWSATVESETKDELLNNLNTSAMVLDENYKFIRVNNHYAKLYGTTKEFLIGKRITDLFDKEFSAMLREKLDLVKSGERARISHTLAIHDGSKIEIEFDLFKVNQQNNKKIQIGVIAHELGTNSPIAKLLEKIERKASTENLTISNNIELNIRPMLRSLERQIVDPEGVKRLKSIDKELSNLNDNFLKVLKSKSPDLTPTELKISNSIRSGSLLKEIAQAQCVSLDTIKWHCKQIRKKLGLVNSKVNLKAYLIDLTND